MAKKYVVTMNNGEQVTVTSKKAVKALEGITQVMVGTEDITSQFVIEEEEAVMEMNEMVVAEIEATTEQTEVAENEVINTVLFTSNRGKATELKWFLIPTTQQDELVKVKGCAAELPVQVAEVLGTDKFVSWVPLAKLEECVSQGTKVRGMSSTFSDVYNRYSKVMGTTSDKIDTVLGVFQDIISDIQNLSYHEGCWTVPTSEDQYEDWLGEDDENDEDESVA